MNADEEMHTLLTVRKRGVDQHEVASRVTDLIYQGADVNQPFRDAATIRSVLSRPVVLGALIKHGANLASPKTLVDGKNVLMLAVENGNVCAVEEILKKARINVNAKTAEGETAAMLAAMKGNVEVIEALVKAGANLFGKDREKNGVMHYAVGSRSGDMVRYLLKKGVNVNMQNQWGMTPLMAAVDKYAEGGNRGDLEVMQELAKASDLKVKNGQGKDVLQQIMDEMEEEAAEDVRAQIMKVFKEEIEDRMKNMLLVSKREGIELPDDVMMKIATLGLDETGTRGHVQKKFSARQKMNH